MPRGNLKHYAPYVFLMKGAGTSTASEYELFVCVPHDANEIVALNTATTPAYTNGTTFLEFNISAAATSVPAGRFFQRISLNPEAEHLKIVAIGAAATPPVVIPAFDPARFCVDVTTKRKVMSKGELVEIKQNIKVFYDTADNHMDEVSQTAFDSPYLYLANPNATTGGSSTGDYHYEPYCLVPIREYNNGSPFVANYAENAGEALQTMTLDLLSTPIAVSSSTSSGGVELNASNGYQEINPTAIAANGANYTDPGVVDGWFEVVVTLQTAGATPKKRKGRVGNISSDTHPTSFIDLLPTE